MRTRLTVILILAALLAVIRPDAVVGGNSREFRGTINNKYAIVMNLAFGNGKVTGTYYYEKHKTNIRLDGVIDAKKQLSMAEFDPSGDLTGSFVGKFTAANRIEGKWVSPDGSKVFPFRVEEDGGGVSPAAAKFVGTWYCNSETLGHPQVTINGDGTYTEKNDFGESRGTYTVSGNTITFKSGSDRSSVGGMKATYERNGADSYLTLESGHPFIKW